MIAPEGKEEEEDDDDDDAGSMIRMVDGGREFVLGVFPFLVSPA